MYCSCALVMALKTELLCAHTRVNGSSTPNPIDRGVLHCADTEPKSFLYAVEEEVFERRRPPLADIVMPA